MIESNNPSSRTRFEQLYKRESDADVKEKMLLVLNVVYDKHIPAAQVARDLHRSRTWASDWLKRYREEGIEGLKNRSKKWQTTRDTARNSIQDKKPTVIQQAGLDFYVKVSSNISSYYILPTNC